MSFIQRLIDIKLELANGVFAGGGNSYTASGLRCSCRIEVPGGASYSHASAAIYGLPLSVMNQLSTIGRQLSAQPNNKITIMAGDAQTGMATVYKGTLTTAFVDAQAMPNVALRVTGMSGYYEGIAPVKPTSVQGAGDVAQIAQGLAKTMNLQFENNGVNVKLSNPYLSGTARQQMLDLARHAGIEHVIDRGKLAIWNPTQGRQGNAVMISPATGLVGYPMFNGQAIAVKTIFDPAINFGGSIQVQSDLTPACGLWKVFNAVFELESQVPHGQWFASLAATPQGATQIAGGGD